MSVNTLNEPYTDVVELCALLQCLGFNIKSMDTSGANTCQGSLVNSVIIRCQGSGLHVVLESEVPVCSCPPLDNQNSGIWQVSAISGGKQHNKEYGSSVLSNLPKLFKERITKGLREMVKGIKELNESNIDCEKIDPVIPEPLNKSASMLELKTTPVKGYLKLKHDTPTRYRSLDTLTDSKDHYDLPPPGNLVKNNVASENSVDELRGVATARPLCLRQSTYTKDSSNNCSVGRRNKTSSPIHSSQNNTLEGLMAVEKLAEELRNKITSVIKDYHEGKNDSSMSSLALDISKISLLKGTESKQQFASSPNLSGLGTVQEEKFGKSNLIRRDSASTSNLLMKSTPKDSTSKFSKLKRISPGLFKLKKDTPTQNKERFGQSNEPRPKTPYLSKPRIVTPVRVPKTFPEANPNLNSSKKKFSHIKSTIPRLSKKE